MERFYFNPDKLAFQKIQITGKQKFYRFLAFTGLTIIASTGFLLFRDTCMTPLRAEKLNAVQNRITYEIDLLNRDIARYEHMLGEVAFNDDYIYRVYFEVNPWPATLRDAGVGGSNQYAALGQEKYGDLLVRTHMNMDQIERKLVVQSTSFDQVIDMARHKEERLAARPAIQPISLRDLQHFGSSFGMRFHPILKVYRPHNGIDLTAARGTPIYVTADGTVTCAGYSTGGYGNRIIVDHGYGYETLYGHCSEILVKQGDRVKRGEVIGKVGSTGLSKSPHLHYEVHVNGQPVDPINYYANDLSPEEYEKMIVLLSEADPSFDIN
jgi:murein DD-endopeptidase MepM/ murein hydrolase activator NlpD